MGTTLSAIRRQLGEPAQGFPEVNSWLNGEKPNVETDPEIPPKQAATVELAIKGLEPGGTFWQDLFRKPITIVRNEDDYEMNGGILAWKMIDNWDAIADKQNRNDFMDKIVNFPRNKRIWTKEHERELEKRKLDSTLTKLIGAWKDAAGETVPSVLPETKELLEEFFNKFNEKLDDEEIIFEDYWEAVPLMENNLDWLEGIEEETMENAAIYNGLSEPQELLTAQKQLEELDTLMAEAVETTKALGPTGPDAKPTIAVEFIVGGLAIAGVFIGGLIVWATVRMQRIRRTQANTEESDELLEYGYDLIYTPIPRTPIELVPSNRSDDEDDEKKRTGSFSEMLRTCEDNKYDYGIRLIVKQQGKEQEHEKLLELKEERDTILHKMVNIQSDERTQWKHQHSEYTKKCDELEKMIGKLERRKAIHDQDEMEHKHDDSPDGSARRRLSTQPVGNPLARMLMEIQSESPNTPELEAIPGNEIVVEQKTELAVLVPIAISVAVLVCLYRKLSLRNTK